MPGVVVWLRDGDRATWIGAVPPVRHWPAQAGEAQVGAMQGQGPDPTARGGFAAYSIWLRLINPPAPERDPRD
jgi:hypothetical protein